MDQWYFCTQDLEHLSNMEFETDVSAVHIYQSNFASMFTNTYCNANASKLVYNVDGNADINMSRKIVHKAQAAQKQNGQKQKKCIFQRLFEF